jgi:hypothetical protein
MRDRGRIKAELRNELRRLGAVKGLDYVYSKGKMGVLDLRTLMYNVYHGNVVEGIASNAKMISEGAGDFADLYNVETIAVTDPTSTNLAGTCKTLKSELSRSDMPVVAGKQITVQILEKNSFANGIHVSGRTLKRGADDALKTIKKAVAFVLPLLNDDGSPKLSGTTHDDIDFKVLDFMFGLLKGKNTVDDAEEDEAEDEVEAESEEHGKGTTPDPDPNPNQASAIRPSDWFFHGWMAFKLFGPMAPQEKHLLLLTTGDPYLAEGVPKTSNGRAAHKDRDALEKENIRSASAGGTCRGLKFGEQLGLANLQLRDDTGQQNKRDTRLFALTLENTHLERCIERAERMAIRMNPTNDEGNSF